jgi:hypothetical protein
MKVFDFDEKLAASKCKQAQEDDIACIRSMLNHIEEITPANDDEDKSGIDYIVRLIGGREITVDVKTREQGCSRYWKRKTSKGSAMPELAIETIAGRGGKSEKIGWTLDHKKETDLILYRWHNSDCSHCFMICFHTLRMTAERMIKDWKATFRETTQRNPQWISRALFVPADIVLHEMKHTMIKQEPARDSIQYYIQQLLFEP